MDGVTPRTGLVLLGVAAFAFIAFVATFPTSIWLATLALLVSAGTTVAGIVCLAVSAGRHYSASSGTASRNVSNSL